jgi:putative membrane protein
MVVSKAMVPAAKAADVAALMHGLLPEAEEFPEAHGVPVRALRFYVLVPTLLTMATTLAALGPASWFLYRPALPWAIGVVVLLALLTAGIRALQWRRAGVGTDEVAVTLRSGAVGIKRVRLTRSRIQSLDVQQNPFQRRAGLATLRTVSVSGSSQARYGVAHLEEAEALRIMCWYQDGLARPKGSSDREDRSRGG